MNCLDFQGLMIPYVNGELSYRQKEQFMEHVKTCADCRDELEIYYIILTSIKQMDEDGQLSDDFHAEYAGLLARTEAELAKRRKARLRRRIAFPVLVGAAVMFTGLKTSGGDPAAGKMVSNFEMKFRFSDNPRHRVIPPNLTEDKLAEIIEWMETRK